MKTQITERRYPLRNLRWVELTSYPRRIKVPYILRNGVKCPQGIVCTIIWKKKDYLLVQSERCPTCGTTYGSLAWIGSDLTYVCGGPSCLKKFPG